MFSKWKKKEKEKKETRKKNNGDKGLTHVI